MYTRSYIEHYQFLLMELFYAAFKKESVTLLNFPLLGYAHLFSCESPQLYPIGPYLVNTVTGYCNLPYLLFEGISWVFVLMYLRKSSMLATSLPPSFLDTYSLSSLRFKVLYRVNFLVLSSNCLRYSLVHFRNGLEYLTRWITQLFIPLMRLLL